LTAKGKVALHRSIELPRSGDNAVHWQMSDLETLQLQVNDANGAGLAGVEASARIHGRSPIWMSRSDGRGALTIALPDGRFDDLLVRRGQRSPWVSVPAAAIVDGSVEVAALGSARVLVELIDSAGLPVPLLGVSCRDALGVSILACERRHDRWVTGLLPAGDHELTLIPASARVAATTVRVASLLAGEERDLGLVSLQPKAHCRLTVTTPSAANDDRLFVLRDEHGDLVATASGQHDVEMAATAGNYRLDVFGQGTEWRMGIDMQLQQGENQVVVPLREGRRRLVVLHRDTAPLPNLRVSLRRIDVSPACLVYTDRLLAENGREMRCEPVLGAGRFELECTAANGEVQSKQQLLVAADTQHLRVEVAPAFARRR
jgi:hypothetical protein